MIEMAQPLVPPGGIVTIYSGVNISNGEQLAFASKEEQAAYFAKHVVATFDDCTYIRDTSAVRLELSTPTHIADMEKANYMSYVNRGFSNRQYFGVISRPRYINNSTVEFDFSYDAIQTFMCEFNVEPCMIEKEQLSAADWETASDDPHNNDILELTTGEGFSINDSSYAILDELVPPVEAITGGPTPGTFSYLPSKLSNNDPHTRPVALFKIAMNFTPETADTVDLKYDSGQAVKVNMTPLYQFNNFNILKMFSGFIVPGYVVKPGSIYTAAGAVQVGLWVGEQIAQHGLDAQFFEGEFDSAMFKNWEARLREIAAQDATAAQNTLDALYSTYSKNFFMESLDRVSNKFDNRELTEAIAWFEYDENGMLPSTFQKALDELAVNDLISSITFAGRVPKFFVEFEPIEADGKVVGYHNISYPTQQKQEWFSSVIQKPKGELHPKIYRYPYDYLRIIMPDKSFAEYSFEKFKGPTADFSLYGDIHGVPAMSVIPARYERDTTIAGNYTDHLNTDETLAFNKFPQINISTDAYLTQMSSEWQNQAGASTAQKVGEVANAVLAVGESVGSIVGAVATGGLTAGHAAAATMSGVGSIGEFAGTRLKRKDAVDILAGDVDKAYTSNFYNGAAEVNKKALLSQNSSVVNLSQAFFDTRAKIEHRTLKPVIAKSLSNSLIRYGCRSGRLGIPRVVNYINGSIDSGDIPQFNSIDSTASVGTPIKTVNAHVTGVDSESRAQIESILNNGCWFWKGVSL